MPDPIFQDVHYDAERRRLEVVSRSGWLYRYFNVPAAIASELGQAEHKADFISRRVRHRYQVRRLPHGVPDYCD